MTFRAPKYSCSICNKTFRRNKQHYNHIMNAHKKRGTKQVEQPVVIELTTMSPAPYIGKPYNFVNIATGNRHLRSGLPLPRLSKYARAAI